MVMSDTNIPDETFDALLLLARGDFNLVEEALIKSLEKRRIGSWWQFWKYCWAIDFHKVSTYIVKRRKEIEDVEINKMDDMVL